MHPNAIELSGAQMWRESQISFFWILHRAERRQLSCASITLANPARSNPSPGFHKVADQRIVKVGREGQRLKNDLHWHCQSNKCSFSYAAGLQQILHEIHMH